MGLEQSSDWHDDGAEEPAEGRQEEKSIRSAGHRIVNIMMVVAKQGEGEGRVSVYVCLGFLVFMYFCMHACMHTDAPSNTRYATHLGDFYTSLPCQNEGNGTAGGGWRRGS